MTITRTTSLRILRVSAGIVVVVLIIAYAVWRSLSFARGPHIIITEPLDGTTITASTTIIKGKVERTNSITLNGRPIFIDEEGNFSETIILFSGSNILTLVANDQFERTVKTEIRVQR